MQTMHCPTQTNMHMYWNCRSRGSSSFVHQSELAAVMIVAAEAGQQDDDNQDIAAAIVVSA